MDDIMMYLLAKKFSNMTSFWKVVLFYLKLLNSLQENLPIQMINSL